MIKAYDTVFRFFWRFEDTSPLWKVPPQSTRTGLSLLELPWVDFNVQLKCGFPTEQGATETSCVITQRPGVIWVSDPLHLQSLQEEWGRQLPHQVNRQGIGLKDKTTWVSSYPAKAPPFGSNTKAFRSPTDTLTFPHSLFQFQETMSPKSDWVLQRRGGQAKWCWEVCPVSSAPCHSLLEVRNPTATNVCSTQLK